MGTAAVFCKTERGRQEVKTRSNLIDQRCRCLLLLIDGKIPAQELIDRVAGLAITRAHFQKLLDLKLVEPVAESVGSPPEPLAVLPGADRRAPVTEAPPVQISNAEKFIQAGNFMNQTAKDLMGLFAAMGFQQKVAKASSLDDLRKLRQVMVEAITKSKGESFARGMAAEFDRLLEQ